MAKLLPKKTLEGNLLKDLFEYYKIKNSTSASELEGWECFSHPSLQLHDCNSRARLLGGHLCAHCAHVPGKPCKLSCDIQHFCLAVFAWRLGIGGEILEEAIKHNLYKLTNDELYREVIKVFSLEGIEEVSEEEIIDELLEEGQNKESIMSELPKTEVVESIVQEEDLLTVKEAATIYGCSYANIYNYVKDGKLPSVKIGTKSRIRKSDLEEFRNRPRSRSKTTS